MQNVVLSLVINVLMAALLMATMVYCRRLNVRVKLLQDSKSDLARIIHDFDESTKRATESIAEIHRATNRLSENIQHKIDKANFLADDLQYMIEKGQKMSGKVDNTPTRPVRNETAAPAATPRATAAPAAAPAAFIMPDAPTARPVRGTASEAASAAVEAARPGRIRSRAEQEIMSALGTKNNTGE